MVENSCSIYSNFFRGGMFKEILIDDQNGSIAFHEYRDNPEPVIFSLSGAKTIELNQLNLEFSEESKKLIYFFQEGAKYPTITAVSGQIPSGVKAVIFSHAKGFDVLFLLPGKVLESQKTSKRSYLLQWLQLRVVVRTIVQSLVALTGKKTRFLEEKPAIPKWFQALGWSSAIAYGEDISHDKVLNAVWSLKQQGYTPRYVLLENGWQNEKERTLINFGADPKKFPSD